MIDKDKLAQALINADWTPNEISEIIDSINDSDNFKLVYFPEESDNGVNMETFVGISVKDCKSLNNLVESVVLKCYDRMKENNIKKPFTSKDIVEITNSLSQKDVRFIVASDIFNKLNEGLLHLVEEEYFKNRNKMLFEHLSKLAKSINKNNKDEDDELEKN
jgi:hypothetical protein